MQHDLRFVKRFKILASIVIGAAICAAFLDFNNRSDHLIQNIVLQQAKGLVNEMMLTRKWVNGHGGVYVPVKPGVEPHPFLLKVPGLKVNIQDEQGKLYTLRNPGLVTREISQVSDSSDLFRIHISSLDPVNKKTNSPDSFEKTALRRFEAGAKEISAIENTKDGPMFRYMAPLILEKKCQVCHSGPGAKIGDVRGGISVSIPMATVEAHTQSNRIHTVMFAIIIILLLFGSLFLLSKSFMRALSEARDRLVIMATTDALTGLPNRTLLHDRLKLALALAQRNGKSCALLFCDLDNFKTINDTLGHVTGDLLLKEVAKRLQKHMREGDTIARLGGDEFVILLPEIDDYDAAAKVAEKVINTLKPSFKIGKRELHIATSIGIAISPNDGRSSQILLKNADSALYFAKERGKNNYQFYTPELNAKALRLLDLENDLRKALNNGEFILHYQPIINIKEHRIVAAEALIRWQHPTLGLLAPLDFIPIGENTGLVVPIGEWALRTACMQNKRWHEAGFEDLRISVNLSARQFLQTDLVERIDAIIIESGMSYDRLELEITESTVTKDLDGAITTLKQLRDKGIKTSIDDFGTGYSSLGYLKQFPIDGLKIDRSFIRSLENDQHDLAITKAIIAMAKGLRLDIVAEGVETSAQLEVLRKLKCTEVQGFLFSKPVPAEEFSRLLQAPEILSA